MINKKILKNGLRVVHEQIETTPLVVVNTLYDVGAKDESEEHTGFAHLFEHLMFGGSANVPSFDEPIQQAGGENNAFTCSDYTNYYEIMPKENLETAFWLESDRMLALDFSQETLDVQKKVVCEEFKQRTLNQPYGDAYHLIYSLAYKKHPYRWPTIGMKLEHIQEVDIQLEKEFFFSHYAPNNAIISIVGNVSKEDAFALVEKWYGDIPRRQVAKRNIPHEPTQTALRTKTVERDVPLNALFRAYHAPRRNESDYYASDMISDLLSNGDSSRLFINLMKEQKLFASVDAYISANIEEGLFIVSGRLCEGTSFEAAEKALDEQLNKLIEDRIEEYELDKVKNKFESSKLFSNLNLSERAHSLAYFELLGDANDVEKEVSKYRAVSVDDVKRVAQSIFRRENCSTLYYKSKK